VLWLRQSVLLAEGAAVLQGQNADATEALAQYRHMLSTQGLTWSVHLAVLAIFLKASILTALALMISCFASSTLFTVITTLLVTIIGHGHQLMRDYFFHPHFSGITEKLLSIFLAILTPDLGAFDIVDNVISGQSVSGASVAWMLGVTAVYLTGYVVVSHLVFSEKEL
jgi:uncharacterized phage infection (PIP) family protein YhgE